MTPMTPTKYLHRELGFKLSEFNLLTDAEKQWYRDAAIAEMKILDIPVKKV